MHIVAPLIDSVQLFDLRDQLFTAGLVDQGLKKAAVPADLLAARGGRRGWQRTPRTSIGGLSF